MAKRDIYARVEPEYLTICNMTVKTVVIMFVLIEMLLTAIACGCCFWFGYFDVGALCVALLVWLIFVLFGTIIGYQWALIPFEVLHCIAVLVLLMAMFGLISLTICPYLHQKWIDFLEDLTIEKSLWFSEIQLENYSRISFGICAGIFVLLISIMVTLISMGYRAYHYLGHYIDEDSPTFESLLDRAVIEAYNRRQRLLPMKLPYETFDKLVTI
ncbi:hypothetical protein Tcan_10398 [Toxocara canis]|uniref:Uncharacterized protein n=1 Tax=Toxocara canis TaxID=6265 RepID=A0A0B2VNK2_TOXCA|nr:hypothetical protein Tcan_10398 [Toxocara canis]